jgi:hypothetical protein
MNHHEGTERLSKKGSEIHDQVSLSLKACRHHNLSEAARWAKSARAEMAKFITILETMQTAEKRDVLKYYN